MRHLAHQDLCSFLASLVFIFSLPGYAAPLQGFVRDGDVHFYGEVVNAGCSVATDSRDQTVHMGQVRSNTFSDIGEWNEPQAFRITLEDCATDVTKNVGVTFTGETDGKDPLVFRTGDSAGSTNGIGLGISDSQGHLMLPNSLPVRYVPLEEGETVLRYTARYRATSRTIRPGNANAQVWFSLYYQ